VTTRGFHICSHQ